MEGPIEEPLYCLIRPW